MPASAAQFEFAAEFVTFLAAAAGVALVLLRGELMSRSVWGRALLSVGFASLGTASFLAGSLLVQHGVGALIGLRAVGIVAVAAGTLAWNGSRLARNFLWAGLACMAGSLVAELVMNGTSGEVVTEALLGLGSAAVVAALLTGSRRSIAARVAASSAGTLLLVVLVLSVALSAVLSSTVEDEATRRLDARASTEAGLLRTRTEEVLGRADFGARVLVALDRDRLIDLAANPRPSAPVDSRLTEVATLFRTSPVNLAYLAADRTLIGRSGLDAETVGQLADTDVVRDAIEARGSRSSVEVAGDKAVVLAASPVIGSADEVIGLLIAATTLDDSFLSARAADDEALSLGLFAKNQRLASVGVLPPDDQVRALADSVLVDGRPATKVTDSRFIAVRAVPAADGRPIVALVASTPTTLVGQTRDSLFRTLFLIALGGTLLALLLAAAVGDRIGGGLRQLTEAAGGIQRGDLSVRSGLHTDDEVGVLGQAFDSMATSIEHQTAAIKQAADDETRLRNRLEAVVAGMGEALVAIDAEGRVTDFNQAAEELSGLTAADAKGQYADDVLALLADDGAALGPRLRKPSPTRWSALGAVVQSDRSLVPVAVSAGVLRGANAELAGNVFVLRDLRREREVERMKTEFLSRVGHELRTPLTGILGFAEILARRDVPAEAARSWHEEIVSSSRRLLRIVEMLEFFASAGAGRLGIRREVVDLGDLITDEIGVWERTLGGKHKIERKVGRALPAVHADRRWLRQAVHELIDNAVKFSPPGSKVTVSAATATRARRKGVAISVIDRGIGMTPEEQATIFTEFTQGDSSDTRTFGGLGLGLALAQRVAEAHGGTVTAESAPGKGSTLTIFVPLEAEPEVVLPARPARKAAAKRAPAKRADANGVPRRPRART